MKYSLGGYYVFKSRIIKDRVLKECTYYIVNMASFIYVCKFYQVISQFYDLMPSIYNKSIAHKTKI